MSLDSFDRTSVSWRQLLQKHRAIAVIRSRSLPLCLSMAKAVADGGIAQIEIAWNGDRPAESIARLRRELPECTIGAGTILNVVQLREAIDSGAQFLFSPHVNLELMRAAISHGRVPIVAGALSPTEILTAWQAGASCVKVFPIAAVGGVSYLKNLQGPLGEIPLIPTGGVTLENAKLFLEAGAIGVGLSSQLFPQSLVDAGNWSQISDRARAFLKSLELEV